MKQMHPVVIPLVFGLVAGAALWFGFPVRDDGVRDGEIDGGGVTPPVSPPNPEEELVANATVPGLVWVFEEGPAAGPRACQPPDSRTLIMCEGGIHHNWPVVLVAPAGDGPLRPTPGAGTGFEPTMSWRVGDAVALVEVRHDFRQCIRAPCAQPTAPWIARLLPTDPAFGVNGYNATNVTFYAFNDEGQVQASNAPAEELARFTRASDYVALSTDPWYLGEGTTPEGMYNPPSAAGALVDQLRPSLVGLPEGGVATAVVETFIGPLTLTLRLEGLQFAP